MTAGAAERLASGVAALQLDMSSQQQTALLDYLALLVRWNTSFNLTAVRDPLDMVHKHLLDSLSVLPWVAEAGQRVLDVGTGGGLPGVPLAIMCPRQDFELLDSNGKKTRFLFQVKTGLGLANMAVRHERAEDCVPDQAFDLVVSRAFASLPDMVNCCAHLCAENGRLLAMKGQLPEQELRELDASWVVESVHELDVPGLDEARHLVIVRRGTSSPQEDATGKNFG